MYTSVGLHIGNWFSEDASKLSCRRMDDLVYLSECTSNGNNSVYFGTQAIPLLEQALSLLKEMQANESADQGADASMEGDNEQGKSTSNEWTDADERKLEEGNSNASADDDVPF